MVKPLTALKSGLKNVKRNRKDNSHYLVMEEHSEPFPAAPRG